MLSAIECPGMDTGKVASRRAPRRYSGWVGPGTFEMQTLSVVGTGTGRPLIARSTCIADGASSRALYARMPSGDMPRIRALPARDDDAIAASRATGSSMSVASETRVAPT